MNLEQLNNEIIKSEKRISFWKGVFFASLIITILELITYFFFR